MITQKMEESLNRQLQKEMYSAYLYLGMSAWCSEHSFNGSANWFMLQYEEEMAHGMKVYHYLLDQGAHVRLESLKASKTDYKSLLDCFEQSLEHERKMTRSFNKLCDFAIQEKDHASYTFFQWFVNEQVEEEATVSDVISKLQLVGDGNGLFMVDQQLAERAATPPTPSA